MLWDSVPILACAAEQAPTRSHLTYSADLLKFGFLAQQNLTFDNFAQENAQKSHITGVKRIFLNVKIGRITVLLYTPLQKLSNSTVPSRGYL